MYLMVVLVIKVSLKQPAMDLIMSLQNICVEVLNHYVMVFNNEAFEG